MAYPQRPAACITYATQALLKAGYNRAMVTGVFITASTGPSRVSFPHVIYRGTPLATVSFPHSYYHQRLVVGHLLSAADVSGTNPNAGPTASNYSQ